MKYFLSYFAAYFKRNVMRQNSARQPDMKKREEAPGVLTVTGSDGTGGAGVQLDVQIIRELGAVPLSAVTTITVQNTIGIQALSDLPADVVEQQVEAIMDDMHPQVVKVGMLRTVGHVEAMAKLIDRYRPRWVVYDPVPITSRGESLMGPELRTRIEEQLLPLCNVVTSRLRVESIANWDVHGLKGAFSTAVATFLALGCGLEAAVAEATGYVNRRAALFGGMEGRGAELYGEFLRLVARLHAAHNDVQFYAGHMNVSPRYLAQVTRRMAGISPKQIIDQYMIKEIERALGRGGKTVQEVAFDFGFSSQSHFSKFFRKMTGHTPTEYKNRKE